MKTLLKNVLLQSGEKRNVLIEDGVFVCLDAAPGAGADEVLECEGTVILPAFYNTHTHAAMSLLRGYADDLPLKSWLEDYIWPFEDGLTPEDIRRGSELAVREMLSTGTVFFCDMYFDIEETLSVVEAAGIRAAIGITYLDSHSKAQSAEKNSLVRIWKDRYDGRAQIVLAPHAIYTASEPVLRHCRRLASETGARITIHLSETAGEVRDCIRDHGTTPVRYLDSIGLLGPDVVAAHCVHVDKEEWDILAERGVTVSHCPCSNMKLGSGRFPYEMAIASGARITIGTDGNASNNNLDMREEMKFAALFAKSAGDPSLLPAGEVLKWATRNGAEAFGINGGVIAPGKAADFILADLSAPKMQPLHSVVSNWVYSADSSCVKSVFCAGKKVY